MPNMTEIPEIIEENEEEQLFFDTRDGKVVLYSGLVSKITTVLARFVSFRKQCSHSNTVGKMKIEMPIDILVQHHPYFYIEAMIA